MTVYKLSLNGKKYDFDDDRMSLAEGIWIKKQTGLVGMAIFQALRDLDPEALAAIYAIALRRDGMVIDNLEDLPLDPERGYIELLEGIVDQDAVEEAPELVPVNRAARRTRVKKPVTTS